MGHVLPYRSLTSELLASVEQGVLVGKSDRHARVLLCVDELLLELDDAVDELAVLLLQLDGLEVVVFLEPGDHPLGLVILSLERLEFELENSEGCEE